MCFIIHERHPTAKIAKKDITCYKFLTSDLEPPVFGASIRRNVVIHFKYLLNKLNDRVVLQEHHCKYYDVSRGCPCLERVINRGYHSYSSIRQVKKERYLFESKFHSGYYLTLVSCIIPKGEVYFFNPINHQYVSSNIIINKIIE
jgi:hypothetical protein